MVLLCWLLLVVLVLVGGWWYCQWLGMLAYDLRVWLLLLHCIVMRFVWLAVYVGVCLLVVVVYYVL